MKIKITVILILCLMVSWAIAQEHHIDMNSGKLEIRDLNRVTLQGHSGSDVVISLEPYSASDEEYEHEDEDWDQDQEEEEMEKEESSKPDRAAGLRMINAAGQSDNTGLGIHVAENAGTATVTAIGSHQKHRYIIKVPTNVNVYYEHNSYNGRLLEIKDIDAEVEASVHYNSIHFENVTGPLVVKAVYGKIEGVVSETEANLSLHSTYGLIDVGIPGNSKRNIILKTTYGQMYTDFDISAKETRNRNCDWCAKSMIGTVNGGGSEVSLSSTYSNIYLRKS